MVFKRDARARRGECVGELHVPLQRFASDTFYANRPATNGARSEKVRRRRCIALNGIRARRDVARRRAAGHSEALPTVARDGDTELRHHREGDFDVRLRYEFTDDLNGRALICARGDER